MGADTKGNQEPTSDGESGYGHPPLESAFKRGVSGNPQGRPKGSKSRRKVYEDLLFEPVTVKTSGQKRVLSRFAIMLHMAMQKAGAGDLRAKRNLELLQATYRRESVEDHEAG